jgi:hypothetical protein
MLLLKASPFGNMKSIIVYCKFQVNLFLFSHDGSHICVVPKSLKVVKT